MPAVVTAASTAVRVSAVAATVVVARLARAVTLAAVVVSGLALAATSGVGGRAAPRVVAPRCRAPARRLRRVVGNHSTGSWLSRMTWVVVDGDAGTHRTRDQHRRRGRLQRDSRARGAADSRRSGAGLDRGAR